MYILTYISIYTIKVCACVGLCAHPSSYYSKVFPCPRVSVHLMFHGTPTLPFGPYTNNTAAACCFAGAQLSPFRLIHLSTRTTATSHFMSSVSRWHDMHKRTNKRTSTRTHSTQQQQAAAASPSAASGDKTRQAADPPRARVVLLKWRSSAHIKCKVFFGAAPTTHANAQDEMMLTHGNVCVLCE